MQYNSHTHRRTFSGSIVSAYFFIVEPFTARLRTAKVSVRWALLRTLLGLKDIFFERCPWHWRTLPSSVICWTKRSLLHNVQQYEECRQKVRLSAGGGVYWYCSGWGRGIKFVVFSPSREDTRISPRYHPHHIPIPFRPASCQPVQSYPTHDTPTCPNPLPDINPTTSQPLSVRLVSARPILPHPLHTNLGPGPSLLTCRWGAPPRQKTRHPRAAESTRRSTSRGGCWFPAGGGRPHRAPADPGCPACTSTGLCSS